jgi:plastocyanin
VRAPALRVAVAATASALIVAPARAADENVHATPSNTWSPSSVTINVGDAVTWINDGGFHNVKFDDGFEQPSEPSATWSSNPRRTFTAAGSYRYVCEQHQSTMIGRVVVQDTSQPPPPGGEPPDTTPPDIDNLKLVPSTFCNKRTKSCPKVGTEIRFTLDEDATITGRIYRRRDGKRVGKLKINATRGANAWPFSGKGLALGKHRLELTPKDAAGNKPPKPSRASFKVASKR